MSPEIVINAVVEGIVDEAVVRRVVRYVRALPGNVYGKNGKSDLLRKIQGYNNAARITPWIVLVDLDLDADCAPPFRANCLPNPARFMCFRVAVREVESWLLADRKGIASFLGVDCRKVPAEPENLSDPKQTMVNLARQSRNRNVRDDMVPRPGSGRLVGPAYASRLIELASSHWRLEISAKRCDSLRRAVDCLKRIKRTYSESKDE